MTQSLTPFLVTCGPFILTLAAWTRLLTRRQGWPRTAALVGLGIATANAAFVAYTFLYYHFNPTPESLPPWKDPQVLNFGLLSLTAPVGMVVGFVAGLRGTPVWLTLIVEIVSIPLFLIGILAGLAV